MKPKINFKPLLAGLMLLVLSIVGCDQNDQQTSPIEVLKSELIELSMLNIENLVAEPFNYENPYDLWGQNFYNAFNSSLEEYRLSKQKDYSTGPLLDDFYIRLPQEYFITDHSKVNLEVAESLYNIFLSLYVNNEINIAINKSILMESHILNTKAIDFETKEYLLKTISILRTSTFLYYSILNNFQNKGEFEDCWIGKLQEMEDSGPFTQALCLASWPLCFGAMLADCAIEVIIDSGDQ